MPQQKEVEEQLEEWGVWEDGLSAEQAQHRYARFAGVDFGVAPKKEWGRMRRDLLEFEPYLASEQHAVGLVPNFPFSLKPKGGVRVHQKPTPLPPDCREWVNREFQALLEAGVVKRAPTARFTSKVVLVEEGQNGQDYRMCINFVDVNQLTEEEKYAMKDTWQLIDIWDKATLGSVLDMKACYHNIPLDAATQELLGVVT